MLPEFVESAVATFTIHVDASANHCTQPHSIVLGLDAIIELGIAIDSKKTIIWEDSSIPTKHASDVSPLNDELEISKSLFATMQPIEK